MPPKVKPAVDAAIAAAMEAEAAAATIEVTTNQQGNPLYIINGYRYTLKSHQAGKVVQECICTKQCSALPWRVKVFVAHEGEHPKVVGPILTHLHDLNPEENAKEAVKAELRKLCKQAPGEAPTNLVSDARGSMDNMDLPMMPTDRAFRNRQARA